MVQERGTDALSQALAEPSRRALLETMQFEKKSVKDLVAATGLKQPNVSNHLAKMRKQGLVKAQRSGRNVFYSLALPFAEVLIRMHQIASPVEAETASCEEELLSEWQERFFEMILNGREEEAASLVNIMLTRRIGMVTIYQEIFQQSLTRIGDLYILGKTDEAHEHMASAIVERMMARVSQFYTPINGMVCTAVVGGVAGNWHYLGLRMLADGLRWLGWQTVFLGTNVPTPSFVQMVRNVQPNLIVISASHADQAAELKKLSEAFNSLRTSQSFTLSMGGPLLAMQPDLFKKQGHDFSAGNLQDFLSAVQTRWPEPCL